MSARAARPVATQVAVFAALSLAMPAARADTPDTACLLPLGRHDAALLAPVARGIGQVYGFRVRMLPARELPAVAWYAPRQRYRAERLLDFLRTQVRPKEPACKLVLAFTAVDVSTTKGGHADWGVLGLSYTREGIAVVSSFRMHRDADAARLVARAVKVSLHETGHAIGLPHRSEGPACLMNDAGGSIGTIDRASGSLCAGERAAAEALLGRPLPKK